MARAAHAVAGFVALTMTLVASYLGWRRGSGPGAAGSGRRRLAAASCHADPNLICGTCAERMYIAIIGAKAGAKKGVSAGRWGLWMKDPGPSMCLSLPKSDVEQVVS